LPLADQQRGRACRLPTMAELQELFGEAIEQGIGPEVWPHAAAKCLSCEEASNLSTSVSGRQRRKASSGPMAGRPRVGQCFLSALAAGRQQCHARPGAPVGRDGYSFVTFRVAYDR